MIMTPFDLKAAKTPSNPLGLEVCTRSGIDVEITDILIPNLKNQSILYPIIAKVRKETFCFQEDGSFEEEPSDYDLMLK